MSISLVSGSFRFSLVILILWAALYLPGLGEAELKGEEGRRALPAIAMLEGSGWIVPTINGELYLRKPPFFNWMIAGAFKATGEYSELAARLPSVLSVLALGLLLYFTARRWLAEWQAQVLAVFWLTTISIIEKGRLAEIEALYVALCGAAFAFWLMEWAGKRRNFALWGIPAIFLGLGMLAKGPTHLLLFYAMVIPVLWKAGEMRRLFSAGHGIALVIIVAIFGAWAAPYFYKTAADNAKGVWLSQAGNVVAGGSRELAEWLPNFPSTLLNALPWLLLAPLLWNRRILAVLELEHPQRAALITATRWPFVITFVGLMVIPGVLPRYTMPLLPWFLVLLVLVLPYMSEWPLRIWRGLNRFGAAAAMVAIIASPWVIRPAEFDAHHWWQAVYLAIVAILTFPLVVWIFSRAPLKIGPQIGATAAIAAACIAFYAAVILPRKALDDDLRPLAAQILAEADPSHSLFVVGTAYEPLFFYVQLPLKFEKSPRKIPNNAKQILFRSKHMKRVQARWPQASQATRLEGNHKKDFFLLKLSPETEKNPRPKPHS